MLTIIIKPFVMKVFTWPRRIKDACGLHIKHIPLSTYIIISDICESIFVTERHLENILCVHSELAMEDNSRLAIIDNTENNE